MVLGCLPRSTRSRAVSGAKKASWTLPLVLVAATLWLWGQLDRPVVPQPQAEASDVAVLRAYREQARDRQLEGVGVVKKILADDNKGSRHQRFVLALGSGHTVLIAHNIDLAPRIAGLRVGDSVAFYGEYEYNAQGGVVHWTHRDPQGRHASGWLKHGGRAYR